MTDKDELIYVSLSDIEQIKMLSANAEKSSVDGLESFDKLKSSIDKINADSALVSDCINEISKIILQTKILSFNASVEAARAGDVGRGFAVIATEMGMLSAQIKKNMSEIEEFSRNIVASVVTTSAIAEETQEKIEVIEMCSQIADEFIKNLQ